MKKRKIPWIVIETIFVVTIVLSTMAVAAQVTRIHANKGHIYIDEGKDSGYTMGAEVCFYTTDGQEITCGQIRQTLPGRAMVQVKNRVAKKIKKGTEAKLKTLLK